jgi:hypothetical protein
MKTLRLGARLGWSTRVASGLVVSSTFVGALTGAACAGVLASNESGAGLASQVICTVYLAFLAPLAILIWSSVREAGDGQLLEVAVPGGLRTRTALAVATAAVIAVCAGVLLVGLVAAQLAVLSTGHSPGIRGVRFGQWSAGAGLALLGVYLYETLRRLRMSQTGIYLLFLGGAIVWTLALVNNPGRNDIRDFLSSLVFAYPWSELFSTDSSRFALTYSSDWRFLILQALLLATPGLACLSIPAVAFGAAHRRGAPLRP